MSHIENIIFLHADGKRFAHPLQHLGKSQEDLPLIAIDSFRHMYHFPKYEHMFEEGRLKQFVEDLYSGKLHREFHYGPEDEAVHVDAEQPAADVGQPAAEKVQEISKNDIDEGYESEASETTVPDSSFAKLGPSKNRYTLVRNEL